MVVDQYQGAALSTTSQVVLSSNPDAFLDNLNAVSAYNNQRGQVMKEFGTQLDRLKLRKAAVQIEASAAEAAGHHGRREGPLDEKAAKAKAVLDDLEAEARAKILAARLDRRPPERRGLRSCRRGGPVRDGAGRQGLRVRRSGPQRLRLLGLTMRAWGAAGVGLPHSSGAQQGSGTRVSESELRPGDLVFYYSPVSHVGMYIGHGLIVNALNPGAGVGCRRSALDAVLRRGPARLSTIHRGRLHVCRAAGLVLCCARGRGWLLLVAARPARPARADGPATGTARVGHHRDGRRGQRCSTG